MNDTQNPVAVPKPSKIRRIVRGLLLGVIFLVAVSALAVLLNQALLGMFEDAHAWEEWRTEHYWALLTWRIMIYTVMTVAWLKLKAHQPKSERLKNRKRFSKIELLVVVLILLVEVSKFVFKTGNVL